MKRDNFKHPDIGHQNRTSNVFFPWRSNVKIYVTRKVRNRSNGNQLEKYSVLKAHNLERGSEYGGFAVALYSKIASKTLFGSGTLKRAST